jgi:hypothetical protein
MCNAPALTRWVPLFGRILLLLGVAGLLFRPEDALAQVPAEQSAPAPSRQDFLFGRPKGWVSVKGTWLMPRAGGDLFTFVRDQLTVERSDFSTPAIEGELGFAITPRISGAGGVEFSRQTVGSEYRRFIDNFGLPIHQTTALSQTNISGSVRFHLRDQGRSISRLAFVPRSILPYVGAGGGLLYYAFVQRGDFVDFVTLRVFPDVFRSQGWAPSAHVFGGTDFRVWRGVLIGIEGRYLWSQSDLDSDFIGFDGIDLNGFRMSSGLSIMF